MDIGSKLQVIGDAHTGEIEELAMKLDAAIAKYISEFDELDTEKKHDPARVISLDDCEDLKYILVSPSRKPVMHGLVVPGFTKKPWPLLAD